LYKRKGKFEIKRAKLGKFNELNLNKAASQISFKFNSPHNYRIQPRLVLTAARKTKPQRL